MLRGAHRASRLRAATGLTVLETCPVPHCLSKRGQTGLTWGETPHPTERLGFPLQNPLSAALCPPSGYEEEARSWVRSWGWKRSRAFQQQLPNPPSSPPTPQQTHLLGMGLQASQGDTGQEEPEGEQCRGPKHPRNLKAPPEPAGERGAALSSRGEEPAPLLQPPSGPGLGPNGGQLEPAPPRSSGQHHSKLLRGRSWGIPEEMGLQGPARRRWSSRPERSVRYRRCRDSQRDNRAGRVRPAQLRQQLTAIMAALR